MLYYRLGKPINSIICHFTHADLNSRFQDKICFQCFFPITDFPLQGYGGYITLMMLESERLIRCAAAQAPIIDWTMYGR